MDVVEFSRIGGIYVGFSEKALEVRIDSERDWHLMLNVGESQSVRVGGGVRNTLDTMNAAFASMIQQTRFGRETVEAE